jgi:single-stranded-DNA-specific exonuclease
MVNDNGTNLDGIGFGLGQLVDHISPASKISLIGELAVNEWNNIRKPQIFIQDVSVESWQLFDHRGVKRIHSMVNTIPNEKRKYIIFNREQLERMDPALKSEAILIKDDAEAKAFDSHQANVVLVDLPPSKELLHHLFNGKRPARIYAYFHK